MRWLWWIGMAGLLTAGCGKSEPEVKELKTPEAVAKAVAANYEKMAVILEKIKDEASFQAAKPELEKAAQRGKELNDRFEGFLVSDKAAEELAGKVPELEKTRKRALDAEYAVIHAVPKRTEDLNDIMQVAGFPRIGVFHVPKLDKALQGK